MLLKINVMNVAGRRRRRRMAERAQLQWKGCTIWFQLSIQLFLSKINSIVSIWDQFNCFYLNFDFPGSIFYNHIYPSHVPGRKQINKSIVSIETSIDLNFVLSGSLINISCLPRKEARGSRCCQKGVWSNSKPGKELKLPHHMTLVLCKKI